MSAPYSDLQSKTEAALKAETEQVSASNRGNASVYLGLECFVELGNPRIECHAEQGEEDPPESGNYWMNCSIKIFSSANESLSTHRSRCQYVFDQFAKDWSTVAAALTGRVTDFTVIAMKDRGMQPQVKDDRTVITEMTFRLLCCPQDFAN